MESSYKKMLLIPFDEKESTNSVTIHNPLDNLKQPLNKVLEKNIAEKNQILQNSNLDDEQKNIFLNKNFQKYNVFAKNILGAKGIDLDEENTPISDFTFLPKSTQNIAAQIMAKLKNNKNIKILKSGEISINKKTLRNSNIHDLLGYLMRNKKS